MQSVMIFVNLVKPNKTNAYMQAFCCQRYTNGSGGAPSTDAFGDVMQSLEIGPFGELVVFRCRRDVCADDVDGKVWDVGDGDLGAVKLGVDG
jgi:hypothetical protein